MAQLKNVSVIALSLLFMTLICAGAPWIPLNQEIELAIIPTYRLQEIQVELPQTNEDSRYQTNIDSQVNETNEEDNEDNQDYVPENGDENEDQGNDVGENDMIIQPGIDLDYQDEGEEDEEDDDDDGFGPFTNLNDDDWTQDFQIYTEEKKIDTDDTLQLNIFKFK